MKVIISAGGTGGHIYPAVAIINKLKEKDKNLQLLYIGTTDRMEKDIIPKMGIDYQGIAMQGINRKNIFKNIKVLLTYQQALKKARQVIKDFDPDVVIGVGGYITAPVISAATKLGYKTIIHEQNAVLGMTNKMLLKKVDKLCVSLKETLDYIEDDLKDKVVYTGNPRSEEIIKIKSISRTKYGFSKDKKLVVIVMGSLGSTTMTTKLKELIPELDKEDYQVLLITGNNYYDEYKNIKHGKNVLIIPYSDELISIMKDTDLIISRAGASTIAEITSIGLPAILVPSPYVTNNHQLKNAKELEKNNACRIIEEDDFNKENVLTTISEILGDEKLYQKMKKGSLSLGVKDSASKIYDEIVKLKEGK